ASNVTGEIWPVRDLVEAAHAEGARVAVDAAQYVPHRRFDLADSGADYVAYSGHKLYAPFGAGVLAGRTDWLRDAAPYLAGGGANVRGAVALAAACDALTGAGQEALHEREELLLRRLRAGLAAIPGVHDLSLWEPDHPRVGIVSFVVDGVPAGLLAAALSAEHGIGVRDGLFCAHLLTRRLLPAGHDQAVRASLGLGTTEEHVDRLLSAVARIAEH